MIYDVFTIWVGKSVYWTLRRLNRHGAALPGLVMEKMNPSLIGRALAGLPHGVVVVTGTNGKTTTTHVISAACKNAGLRVFTNHSGSNMTRGLLASIARFADSCGRLPYDIAVLEIDEAYAAKLASVLKPRYAVLTNVLRDQLDRFGEIDHTAALMGELAKHTTELVIANGQDPRIVKVLDAQTLAAKVVWFGHDTALAEHYPNDDDWHSKTPRKVIPPGASWFVLHEMKDGLVTIKQPEGQLVELHTKLDGWHNGMNVCAAFSLIKNVLKNNLTDVFEGVSAPYGRGELLCIGEAKVLLQLVKNPAGFRIAMDVRSSDAALIVINDAYADSRDVSWLWDVDVEPLRKRPTILTSGTRAKDLAVRLKYAEISVASSDVSVEESLRNFMEKYNGGVVFLTYTAMLQVRKMLLGWGAKPVPQTSGKEAK